MRSALSRLSNWRGYCAGFPQRLIVYGVEGRDFRAGTGLSPETEEAISDLVPRVLTLLPTLFLLLCGNDAFAGNRCSIGHPFGPNAASVDEG